jgi:hypothetical protein
VITSEERHLFLGGVLFFIAAHTHFIFSHHMYDHHNLFSINEEQQPF